MRWTALALGLVLLAPLESASAQVDFGWTLSASRADPFVNADPESATIALYLSHSIYGFSAARIRPACNPPIALRFSGERHRDHDRALLISLSAGDLVPNLVPGVRPLQARVRPAGAPGKARPNSEPGRGSPLLHPCQTG